MCTLTSNHTCRFLSFSPGAVAEQIGDLDRALSAYENALRHNPHSLAGLTQVAGIARIRENYTKVSRLFFSYDVPQLPITSRSVPASVLRGIGIRLLFNVAALIPSSSVADNRSNYPIPI